MLDALIQNCQRFPNIGGVNHDAQAKRFLALVHLLGNDAQH